MSGALPGISGITAIVTGGGSGIGAACAAALADAGARVCVLDRSEERAGAQAVAVGGRAYVCDVADEAKVEQTIAAIEKEEGPIAALVNAAGILQRILPPDKLTLDEWDAILRVDLRGIYLTCATAGTRMARRGKGAIVNVASVSGMRSAPLHGYGPAKAGVIQLGECLAAEWGRVGVRVNTVSPGFTDTPALQKSFALGALDRARLTEASALGRLVAPAEIAAAVLFLCSDLASGITGVNLPVDVGYLVAAPWGAYGGAGAAASATDGRMAAV